MTHLSISQTVLLLPLLILAFVSTLFASLLFWVCAPFEMERRGVPFQHATAPQHTPMPIDWDARNVASAVGNQDAVVAALYKRSLLG